MHAGFVTEVDGQVIITPRPVTQEEAAIAIIYQNIRALGHMAEDLEDFELTWDLGHLVEALAKVARNIDCIQHGDPDGVFFGPKACYRARYSAENPAVLPSQS